MFLFLLKEATFSLPEGAVCEVARNFTNNKEYPN